MLNYFCDPSDLIRLALRSCDINPRESRVSQRHGWNGPDHRQVTLRPTPTSSRPPLSNWFVPKWPWKRRLRFWHRKSIKRRWKGCYRWDVLCHSNKKRSGGAWKQWEGGRLRNNRCLNTRNQTDHFFLWLWRTSTSSGKGLLSDNYRAIIW